MTQALKTVQSGLPSVTDISPAQQLMLHDAAGQPVAKMNAEWLSGAAYGICSTAATTVAKTAAISNFILLKNRLVAILFQTAVDVAAATLNVSNSGAKPIYYHGAALQPGVVRAGNVVSMQYDGTRYNIIAIEGQQQTASPSDLYVDMGLPSGVLWAKANIDITTNSGFQEVNGEVSPFKYECSFCSWGNTDMHNPTSNSAFSPYTWGGINKSDPPYDGQVYGSTPGNALTANIGPSADAARANLGAPWRMPTTTEFKELFDNCEYVDANGDLVTEANSVAGTAADKRVTVSGIVGLRLRSKINGNILFFPCSGYGYGTSRNARGSRGYYWSSSWNSARNARNLDFYPSGVYSQSASYRYYGFAVRPVQ